MSVSVPEATLAPDKPSSTAALPSLRELRLVPLLTTLVFVAVVLFVFWTALQSVFLALQIQQIDPKGAAGGLALVVGIGAIGALLSAPIAGALSDRTRTRIGGRAPWMLVGAVATVVLAILLAQATSITELAVYWLLIQASTNFVFTPILVHIPERVPVARRGIFSASVGLSHLLGVLFGQVAGAVFADELLLGYLAVSALLLVAVLTFALVNKRSNLGVEKPPMNAGILLRTFWVNPVRYPAFGWTFLGRFLILTGFFPLTVYLLYILQDYAGLGAAAVKTMPLMGLAGMLGSAVGTPLAGWLSDRLDVTRPLIYACSAVMVAAIAVPLAFPNFAGLIVYSFLIGAGFGGFGSVDYVLITKVLPSQDDAGKDLGIINTTTTLSQTLGVGLAGGMVSFVGSYSILFVMGIVFIILGAACVAFIRDVR
ncbi:MFS transporter [Sphingobium fluviale]|nr:MFS transporter [Sphingobium fluviale]